MSRLPAALAAALLAVAMSAATAHGATSVSVSGKLPGAKGFSVLAVSPDGSAVRTTIGAGGSFKLKLKSARGATLQLIRPTGGYFGPVVLATAKRRNRVHLALSGKAVKLGTLKLRTSWAQAGKKVPATAIATAKTARAQKNGKPAGAGSLGLEARKATRATLARTAQDRGGAAPDGGADADADGLPNTVDVDDNGNGVLDASDPESRGSAGLFTTVNRTLETSVNVNAGGVDAARLDDVAQRDLRVNFYLDHREFGGTVSAVDVDCFTLIYCRRGDGPALMGGMSESGPLPEGSLWRDFDGNGNGLPDVPAFPRGGVSAIAISPKVPVAQINAGDLLDLIVTTPGGKLTRPTAIPPYFITNPALAAYDAGAGTQPVSYPAAGTPGTQGTPIQLVGEKLTLTFWRPQRRAIAGAESGAYVDMGNLHYGIPIETGGRQMPCAGHYSNLSPSLREAAPGAEDFADQLFPLADSAADAAPDAANRLSFTLDLGACMRASGVEPAGQSLSLGLTAGAESRPGGNDRAVQLFNVCLPGCAPVQTGPGGPTGSTPTGSTPTGSTPTGGGPAGIRR